MEKLVDARKTSYLPWVDYAKCFSILLVIAFHCPAWNNGYMGDVLQLLRMPAFFLISGFLFREDKYRSLWAFVKHRSIQLLVPYTTFFIAFYALWLVIGRQLAGAEDMSYPLWWPLWEQVYGTPGLVVATYWFIACLFCMQVIYYLLARYVPLWLRVVLIVAAPLVAQLPYVDAAPWNIHNALLYLPYYAFANLAKNRIASLNASRWAYVLPPLAVTLVGLRFIDLLPDWLIQPSRIVLGLCILPTYILIMKALPTRLGLLKRAAGFVGRNTIILLAIQNYVIAIFKLLAAPLIASVTAKDYDYEWFLLNVGAAICVVLVGIPVILFIKHYTPWMIGRGHYFEQKLKQYT